ncbi:MAG: hypothetical protein RQ731_10040, partial [Anaerosomatales bacterium]|nr:hypothetical protein [Anaerosomatales bacterium]
LIFRLVSSKNSQSYGTTIDDLWDSCDRLKLSLPQKQSIAPSSFCAPRKKLDESIFACINTKILRAYASHRDGCLWRGHRCDVAPPRREFVALWVAVGGREKRRAEARRM